MVEQRLTVSRQIRARLDSWCCLRRDAITVGQRISKVSAEGWEGWAHDSCVIAWREGRALGRGFTWLDTYTPTDEERREHDHNAAMAFLRSKGSQLGRAG